MPVSRVADGECHVLREDQGRLKEELATARTELRERGTELQWQVTRSDPRIGTICADICMCTCSGAMVPF